MQITDALTKLNLETYLQDFEKLLRESVAVDDDFLSEVSRHLMDAGGKRIRPVLAITSAAAGGAEINRNVLLSGIAVELVHLGSLYHDDVMDDASDRRNVESVNFRWGNVIAIVAGDYLLAKAAGIAARLGQEIAELLSNTLAELCAGQILEAHSSFSPTRTEDSYFKAISGKTASLMATACRIGALAANLDSNYIEIVTGVGRSLGMVFQIRDDILDLVATADVLGKAPAQDLLEGIYTLPVIEALKTPYRTELESLLTRSMDEASVDRAVKIILSSGGIATAWRNAQHYAKLSRESAAQLDSPIATELGMMAQFLLDNTFQVVQPYLEPPK